MRLSIALLLALTLCAQAPAPPPAAPSREAPLSDQPPVITRHEITVGGRTLRYEAHTGYLPLKSETGDIEANLFYVAYKLDGAGAGGHRPLTFCFNGGPGAGSLWLHLGAIGPKRVRMLEDGGLPPPPYELVENEGTWLDRSDLVFVDPVGTGFSRAKNNDIAKKYFSVGDIDSIGQFIRLFLTRNQRWNSPLFLAGESYGTTRAAGLAGWLADHGIGLNGVFLISTILNFQTARFALGNDLPYPLFLPTYTAIAWYHKKLPPDLQSSLEKAVAQSRKFAAEKYLYYLHQGDRLTAAERKQAIQDVARLTGLSERYVDLSDLRIRIDRFCKELLRDRRRTIGRLDGRFEGMDAEGVRESFEFDPSMAIIRPPFTSTMTQYARAQLNFDTDREYYALGGGITSPWDFGLGPGNQGYADTSEALRQALSKNPYTKVFVASGYYDLATPFYAAEYTLSHMGLDPSLKKNIRFAEYEAGHMMYIHRPSLVKLKKDADAFYEASIAR